MRHCWTRLEFRLHRHATACLFLLLAVQTVLLAWQAFDNSPVLDEPAHLAAGLSHWRFGRFDLYRVNPPLVRSVAALSVLMVDHREDWHSYQSQPLAREEFVTGQALVSANGKRILTLMSLARLACIPFSWVGMVVSFLWARQLAGNRAAVLAATMWICCPNLLAHGALITPDAAATSSGLLASWRFHQWLRHSSWRNAVLAGGTLSIALLTKSTWLLLLILWPSILLVQMAFEQRFRSSVFTGQLIGILTIGLYGLNAGYLFEGSLRPLEEFQFLSRSLTGLAAEGDQPSTHVPGNRFAATWLSSIPVPLPADYVEGIDLQKVDFELGQPSYLRGEWRDHGWWYYYLYAILVKTPVGLLMLSAAAAVLWWKHRRRFRSASLLTLVLPALMVLTLVSLQTGFNKHLRYILPVLPFAWLTTAIVLSRTLRTRSGMRMVVWLLLSWSAVSCWAALPNGLTYFNEPAGGPERGWCHLLGSNLDWGQRLGELKRWNDQRTDDLPLFVSCDALFDPADIGIPCRSPSFREPQMTPGWYAISINRLQSSPELKRVFGSRPPEIILGHTIRLFCLRSPLSISSPPDSAAELPPAGHTQRDSPR
ncbi:MAG: glycosyltransferase family 39 protein [Planctomycetaceae bacterium]